MNDSFVDFDLLAKVDPDTHKILRPSLYSEMVWEQKKRRAMRDSGSIDWIVMRNRLGSTEAKNKRAVGEVLDALARIEVDRRDPRPAIGERNRDVHRRGRLAGAALLVGEDDAMRRLRHVLEWLSLAVAGG
jgi:chromosome partitioning protein